MYELIPDELKALPNWVCWRAVPDPKAHSGISKQPINPRTGGMAQSNNPQTWSDFDTAVRVSTDFAGIGFMFGGSGYFGVDIDDNREALADFLNGDHSNVFGEFSDALKSYTELSYSGNGVHIICRGQLPPGGRRSAQYKLEMYDTARFFVMTGNVCGSYVDIADGTEAIRLLHQKYFQKAASIRHTTASMPTVADTEEIIRKACEAANGEKFARLFAGDSSDYQSKSEADMAFCNMLAFWCGGNPDLMDSIYRSSGLMREKWDRAQSGSTYGKLTMQKAVESCSQFYRADTRNDSYMIRIGQSSEQAREKVYGKRYSFDDTGNAQRLHDAFGEILRYSYIDKKWLYYYGGKWVYDNTGYIRQIADAATVLQEQELQYYEGNEDMEKAFQKHLKRSRSFAGKSNMIREAEHYAPILPSQLDCDRTVINCKNGIVDLRSGELLPHDQNRYLTKQTAAAYNPDAPEPTRWLQFLQDIFDGDADLIRYIQKCVGYSLTGSTAEQCAFFLYGNGRNGKSTFLEIIRSIMGDYATNIQPQTIMVNPKSGNAPSSDIARLKGARLVTSVEPNEGMRIDEGLLKQLTGDDVVTARKMFSEEFEFKPEFKLWMATNHKPIIRGTDTGIWRRIHMIPFTVQIPEEQKDKHLKYKLAKESEGILRWAVEGCLLWQQDGLRMPKQVLEAVREYKREMDSVGAFIDACCTVGEGSVKASKLFAVYAKWADEHNEHKFTSTKFGVDMSKRFQKRNRADGIYYDGIRLDDQPYSVSIG